jgi:homocysteine S-methyltransferase
LSKNINILDGGFGQAIINKGLDQIGTLWGCSAYLNEKDHQKVIDTHLEFIKAGSKMITTSNFTIRKRRLAQNKLENRLKDFLEISGKLAQEAVNISNKDIEIAGSLPTRG